MAETPPTVRRSEPSETKTSSILPGPTPVGKRRSRWRLPLLAAGPAAAIVLALTIYFVGGRYVSEDNSALPHPVDFISVEQYYSTAFHELCHWTGAKHRLNRDFTGKYRDAKYSFEENVAELGAAFVFAHLGIKAEMRHAGYILP